MGRRKKANNGAREKGGRIGKLQSKIKKKAVNRDLKNLKKKELKYEKIFEMEEKKKVEDEIERSEKIRKRHAELEEIRDRKAALEEREKKLEESEIEKERL